MRRCHSTIYLSAMYNYKFDGEETFLLEKMEQLCSEKTVIT